MSRLTAATGDGSGHARPGTDRQRSTSNGQLGITRDRRNGTERRPASGPTTTRRGGRSPGRSPTRSPGRSTARSRWLRLGLVLAVAALAALALAPGSTAAQAADLSSLDGDGTVEDPYVIEDVAGLQAIERDLDANYVLGSDVDASAAWTWNGGEGFEPIGSANESFRGTLDGRGHEIRDLRVDGRREPVAPFHALEPNATVERIVLANVSVENGIHDEAPAAGVALESRGTVRDVSVSGEVQGGPLTGGLVGVNYGTVERVRSTVEYSTSVETGGLVGRNRGTVRSALSAADDPGCGYGGGECPPQRAYDVGNRSDGTIEAVYAIGPDHSEFVHTDGVIERNATGADARDSMPGLAFGDGWYTTPGLPKLAVAYDGPELRGTGTAAAPFEVATAADLREVHANLTAQYVLVDDVDAAASADWNDGPGFEPLGSDAEPFAGTFDGDGHLIANLSIDRPEAAHVGPFGVVEDGTVRDVGLEHANVTGGDAVGALVGTNRGTVERARATGRVRGDRAVGGLVGANAGSLTASYATASVEGQLDVGGLVGSHRGGAIEGAFAAGAVDGEHAPTTGGLLGDDVGGDLAAGYWDVDATGQNGSDGGVGLSTGELTGEDARSNASALSVAAPPTYAQPWVETEGYPALRWEVSDPVGLPGSGTAEDPYQIDDADDLSSLRSDLEAHYVLVDDVDASATAGWNDGRGLEPVGDASELRTKHESYPDGFAGTLDGRDHVVRNLTIDRPGEDGVGLFAALGADATVRNLTLANASVRGGEWAVGGLAGANVGTVRDVAVTGELRTRTPVGDRGRAVGSVVGKNAGTLREVDAAGSRTGAYYVGGVVGSNRGTVRRAAARGVVSGTYDVGGVAGRNTGLAANLTADATVRELEDDGSSFGGAVGWNYGRLERAVAYGDVVAPNASGVGGLLGEQSDVLVAGVAHGTVTGGEAVGGLAGSAGGERTAQAVATGQVAGESDVGGLVGRAPHSESHAAYWDANATEQNGSAVGTGLSTGNLTGASAGPATDLSFGEYWRIADGYPRLVDQYRGEWDVGAENRSRPSCVTVAGERICDVDRDGLFRDANGDGEVGHADVRAFFDVQHRPGWKRPAAFDFNGNDRVGHGDVLSLFEHVAASKL